MIYRQKRACNRAQHITDITDIGIDRHHNIGIFVGIVRTDTKLIVQLFKLFYTLLFVAEYFNDFLPAYHFFDKTVYRTQILLLASEIHP